MIDRLRRGVVEPVKTAAVDFMLGLVPIGLLLGLVLAADEILPWPWELAVRLVMGPAVIGVCLGRWRVSGLACLGLAGMGLWLAWDPQLAEHAPPLALDPRARALLPGCEPWVWHAADAACRLVSGAAAWLAGGRGDRWEQPEWAHRLAALASPSLWPSVRVLETGHPLSRWSRRLRLWSEPTAEDGAESATALLVLGWAGALVAALLWAGEDGVWLVCAGAAAADLLLRRAEVRTSWLFLPLWAWGLAGAVLLSPWLR